MIARTTILAATLAVLPFSAVARPQDAAARDVLQADEPVVKREPIAAALVDHIRSAEETIENSNILVKESPASDSTDEEEEDVDDGAKGKGGGSFSFGGDSGAVTTAGRPASALALAVAVAAVVVTSLIN